MSDHYIKEASALLEQAKGALSSGADKAKEMAGNPDIQKLLPYLLAGGAGAAGGALLSGRRKLRAGETRGQYLTRILRNAVVAGGLAGGGSYLAGEGFKKTLGAVDVEHPLTGKEGDQGPLGAVGRGALFSPLTAAGTGTAVLGATVGNKYIGANPGLADAEKQLAAGLNIEHKNKVPTGGGSLSEIKHTAKTDNAKLQTILGKADTPSGKTLREQATRLGVNTHDASKTVEIPDILKKILGVDKIAPRHLAHEVGRPISSLMGRTTGRRVGRGALGLGAALLPAIAGSILSDRPE